MINWKKYPKKKILGTGDSIIVSRPDGTTINFDSPISVDNIGNATFSGNVTIQGNLSILNSASQTISFGDNDKLKFGDGNDLEIYHDGSNSYIDAVDGSPGYLYIRNTKTDGDINFVSDDGSGGEATYFYLDGSQATHNGSFTTATYTIWGDRSHIAIGGAKDMQLYHDGSNSYIQQIDGATGDLIIEQGVDDKDIILKSDDGSGGVTAYLTLDGSAGYTVANKDIYLVDDVRLRAGTSGDFSFFHDGSNSKINNNTGNIRIENFQDDGDIQFFTDDGSGGTTEYLRFDGGQKRIIVSENTRFSDTVNASFGNGNDLKIYHNGSASYIDAANSDLYIRQEHDDADIIFQCDDGSGGTTDYIRLDGSATAIEIDVATNFKDNGIIIDSLGGPYGRIHGTSSIFLGGSSTSNVQISAALIPDGDSTRSLGSASRYWSHGYIDAITTTGNIIIGGDLTVNGTTVTVDTTNLNVQDKNITLNYSSGDSSSTADGAGITIQDAVDSSNDATILWDATNDEFDFSHGITLAGNLDFGSSGRDILFGDNLGAALEFKEGSNLYMRFVTTNGSEGIDMGSYPIRSNLIVGADGAGHDVKFFLNASGRYIMVDEDDNSLIFTDNASAKWGNGGDLQLMHDGTDSRIDNMVGHLKIRNYSDDSDIIFETDNGSGGTTEYFRLDGGNEGSYFSKHVHLIDSVQLRIGNGNDAAFYHDGYDTYLTNDTGDFYIQNTANDKDVIFRCDDGSGGNATYFYLDGSLGGGDGAGTVFTIFPDNARAGFGANADLRIYHDGTNSKLLNLTGDIVIQNNTDDGDITFATDDGSGSAATYFRLDGSVASHDGSAFTALYTSWVDKSRIALGSSRDMQLYHDGTSSYIQNQTGNLTFRNFADDTDIIFETDDGSGGYTPYITLDGSATSVNVAQDIKLTALKKLYFDGGGDTYIVENTSNNLQFVVGGNQKLVLGNSISTIDSHLEFQDNYELRLGTNADMQFFHTGTHLYMYNATGNMTFRNNADNADIIFQSDDGSGGTTTYFQLDGSHTETVFSQPIRFADSEQLKFGASSDLQLYHNGSHSYIAHGGTGNLYIQQTTDDADIIFTCDDGSGGNGTYFTLDGSTKYARFSDNIRVTLGDSDDLQIKHDGTDSDISNYTGDLYIQNHTDDKDIIFKCDDGSGGNTTYFFLDGSQTRTQFDKDIMLIGGASYIFVDNSAGTMTFADNVKAQFGDSGDLKLYHTGTGTVIQNATGNLTIQQDHNDYDIIFRCDDGSGGTTPYITLDGSATTVEVAKDTNFAGNVTAVNLNLTDTDGGTMITLDSSSGDGVIRWEDNNTQKWDIGRDNTDQAFVISNESGLGDNQVVHINHSTGEFTLKGALTVGVDDTGHDVIFYGATSGRYLQWDESQDRLEYKDGVEAVFGNDNDLRIYHSTQNYIIGNGGDIIVEQKADDKDIILKSDDGSGGTTAYITLDGSATTTVFYKDSRFNDGIDLNFGNANDLILRHDGSNSYMLNGTGDLYIRNNADDKDIIFQSDDGSGGVETYFFLDGSAGSSNPRTIFPDDSRLCIGTGEDLNFSHESGHSYIQNTTGDLYIKQRTDDGDLILSCDDGSGGDAAYLTLDGGLGFTQAQKKIRFKDSVEAEFGDQGDFLIKHTGSHADLTNGTGDIRITNNTDDGDILLKTDDGSGGITTYLQLDGSHKRVIFPNDIQAAFGSSSRLVIVHDGTDATIRETQGDLQIVNTADDKDIIFQSDNGTGSTTTYFMLDGSLADGTYFYTKWPDNSIIALGSSNDLVLWHDGSNSYIRQVGTGDLYIENTTDDKDIIFRCDDSSGSIEEYFRLDGSANTDGNPRTKFPDNSRLMFGAGDDMDIFHNGTNSFIRNNSTSGDLIIQQGGADKDIILKCDDGSGGETAYLTLDGSATTIVTAVPLHIPEYIVHDGDTNTYFGFEGADQWRVVAGGSEKIHVNTSRIRFNEDVLLLDSHKLNIGSDNDLQIYHDGSNSYIVDAGTGDLLNYFSNEWKVIKYGSSETCIEATSDGSVDLYYDNSKKLETTSAGVTVTGNVTHDGLTPTTGTDIDQIKEFAMSFTLSADTWTDTGIDGTDLATGTYMMQVYVDDHSAGGGHYDEYYSATISWFSTATNSSVVDEIVVHRAGHAPNASHVQFRTQRHASGGDDLMLQVKQNFAHSAALDGTDGKTMTFKFRRLI